MTNASGAAVDASMLTPTEAANIQAFLDARYTAGDVTHSFVTKFGQTIDCVDFFSLPAVKALGITELPEPPPDLAQLNAGRTGPLSDVEFNGALDQNGSVRACPAGSAPKVRITAATILAAGGLGQVLHALSHKGPPPMTPACSPGADAGDISDDAGAYAHVIGVAPNRDAGPGYNKVYDHMSIFAPAVPTNTAASGDHSLSQTWTYSGTCFDDFGDSCTGGNCVQSVELGWDVDPNLDVLLGLPVSGDQPALFTFGTANGYASGCYDDIGSGCLQGVDCARMSANHAASTLAV
jgi:hypothetical protein